MPQDQCVAGCGRQRTTGSVLGLGIGLVGRLLRIDAREAAPDVVTTVLPGVARMATKTKNPSGAAARETVTDGLRSFGLWPGPGATTWRPTMSPPSARDGSKISKMTPSSRPYLPNVLPRRAGAD